MGYGTNGMNSDGTLMNQGNMLGKRSIRLLGREKGYDTGHAMAALLGLRSLTADEEDAMAQEEANRSESRGSVRKYQNTHTTHAASSPTLPTSYERDVPVERERISHLSTSAPHLPHTKQKDTQHQAAADLPESALRVGMRIITTKPIELHSGNSLRAGVIGVVCKVPGDLPGTVAEVDIPNGPLFDAWPGTIVCVDAPQGREVPQPAVPQQSQRYVFF